MARASTCASGVADHEAVSDEHALALGRRFGFLSSSACLSRHNQQRGPRSARVGDGEGMRRDLVEAAARGDHEAFEVLATSAGDRLYAVARLIVRSTELAEDAVQEALVARLETRCVSTRPVPDDWLHRPLQAARPADFKPG
ncbi:MAG: hypothetical protein M3452_08210 [Chloroflexota bacterium]|nr:hypothetical protein [Chloroflexota bacterium]